MSMAASDRMVTDRWAEFRRLARSKGTVPQESSGAVAGAARREQKGKSRLLQYAEAASETTSNHDDLEAGRDASSGNAASGFMRDFFDSVGQVQSALRQGRECVQQIDKKLEEVLRATTQDRQSAVSDELARLADAATDHIAASKSGLDALKAKAEADDKAKASPAERRIRSNMQQAMAKKHQQLLLDFQRAQLEFKRVLEQQQAREMQILCPDASPDEVAQMIEAGQTSSQMVMRRMAGAHANVLDEVERIRDKYQDIVRLEQSIQDLAQMFQEIAVLVDAQGELLDSIEKNVENTVEYTGGGVKQLDKALKIQHSTRKWQCCLSVFCMLILLVILGPILFR